MLITRATNKDVLILIMPHLVEDKSLTRDVIVVELAYMMEFTPDDIFVSVAFDGKDLVAYTIGWIPKNREYIWLGQSWIKSGVSRDDVMRTLELVEEWGRDLGISEIRFETERKAEALERAWGFNIHGYVMMKEL